MPSFNLSTGYLAFTALHFVLFTLAVTVCGLYGTDLQHANKVNQYDGSKWVYAVVVGTLSAVTCVAYFVPLVLTIASLIAAAWDLILFILWIALFGVFGKLYIHKDAAGNRDVQRMRNAVWVVLTSALLWLIAAMATLAYWWKHRDTQSRFTGRARV